MNAKRFISAMLMWLLLIFMVGCGCDSSRSDPYHSEPYKGSPQKLVGSYIISGDVVYQSATNTLFGTEAEYRNTIDRRMDISLKDPNTLTAKFGPKGEPFDLVFDRKTGKAKGTDNDGFKWEIQFNSEEQTRSEIGNNGKTIERTENVLVMESVTREKTGMVGLRKNTMKGRSRTGVSYDKSK